MDFRVTQFCQPSSATAPSCAVLEPDPDHHAQVAPIMDIGHVSTEPGNLPAQTRVGDVLVCHVHQRDVAIDSANALTRVDQCRVLVHEISLEPRS